MKIVITDTFIKSIKKITNRSIFNRISTMYYNIKWSIKNTLKYIDFISEFRPWDYSYIIKMMEFQLSELCNYIEKYGQEVDESRLPKIENMRCAIKLLNNHIKDNYLERCGYDDRAELIKLKDDNSIEIEKNPGYENYDANKIFSDAYLLEEKEWDELFNILKKMRWWWD